MIVKKDELVICLEGCLHGELDKVYKSVQQLEQLHKIKIDLLINCGDFQALRSSFDLPYMKVPEKYKILGDFHSYYSGQKTAPYLTIFIGGNHEASNYLKELPFGGWVCPRIYYLGQTGVIKIHKNGKTYIIAGISGIYHPHSFNLPRNHEQLPLSVQNISTAYHYRQVDVLKLAMYQKNKVDLFISHDWPNQIYHHGNLNQLLKMKPFFQKDIQSNQLGSPPLNFLMQNIMPVTWASAHLHVKFEAQFQQSNKVTNFIALDKCIIQRQQFLQLLLIQPQSQFDHSNVPIQQNSNKNLYNPDIQLSQDLDWINLCRQFEIYIIKNGQLPSNIIKVIDNNQTIIDQNILSQILEQFKLIQPIFLQEKELIIEQKFQKIQQPIFNYQTDEFLKLIQVQNKDFYLQFNNNFDLFQQKKYEKQQQINQLNNIKKNQNLNIYQQNDQNEILLDLEFQSKQNEGENIDIQFEEFGDQKNDNQQLQQNQNVNQINQNSNPLQVQLDKLPFK